MIIVILLFLILFIVNAWYWSRIYFNNVETTPVTRSEAGWLFALNAIWSVVALGLLIYSIVALVRTQKTTNITFAEHNQVTTVSQPYVPMAATTVGPNKNIYRLV